MATAAPTKPAAAPVDPMQEPMAMMAKADADEQTVLAEQSAAAADRAQRQAAAEAPLMQRQSSAMSDIEQMAAKGPERVAMPQQTIQRTPPKHLLENAQPLMALAALSGFAVRRPLIGAMSAMTGAMEGLKAGDEARYQQGMAAYKEQVQQAIDQNDAKMKEYERVLKSKEFTVRQIDAELRAVAKRFGDEGVASGRSFKERLDAIGSQRKAAQHMADQQRRHEEFEEKRRDQNMRHQQDMALRRALFEAKMQATAAGKGGSGGSAAGAPGSVNARMAGRQTESILGAVTHLTNIVQLPAGTSIGAFGAASVDHNTGAMRALASQSITADEDRAFQQLSAGLESELAALQSSGGAGGSGALIKELQTIRPRAGDSKAAMFRYLALARQSVEIAKHGLDVWPAATQEQKDLAQRYVDHLNDAVPWSVADVIKLARDGKSAPTIKSAGAGAMKPAAPASATVNGKTYQRPAGMSDQDWADYKREMGAQ